MYTKLDRVDERRHGREGHRRAGTPTHAYGQPYGMILLVPPIGHHRKPLASPITPFLRLSEARFPARGSRTQAGKNKVPQPLKGGNVPQPSQKIHADELRSLPERVVKEEQLSLGTRYTSSLSLTLHVNPGHREQLVSRGTCLERIPSRRSGAGVVSLAPPKPSETGCCFPDHVFG